MLENEQTTEENFNFNDFDEEQNINAILNDQQESKFGLLKNLGIVGLILVVGIGVFWGSFMLGKKVFTAAGPQTTLETEINLEEELAEFAMPEENILYEIETSERFAKAEQKEDTDKAKESVKETVAAKPAPKKEVKSQLEPVIKPAVKEAQTKPASKPVQTAKEKIISEIEKTTAAIKAPVKVASKAVMFKVIAGSYSSIDNASVLKKQLNKSGFDVYIAPVDIKGKPMYRVQVGAFDTEDQAKTMIKKVRTAGHDAFYIQE